MAWVQLGCENMGRKKSRNPAIVDLESDEMCLVCGVRPRGSVMKHNRPGTLYCGFDCAKAAQRNFKRRTSGDTIGKLVLTLKSLTEDYGHTPVSANQWLNGFRERYKTTLRFERTLMLTNMVRGIINPETIEIEKDREGWQFRYLGGETISEWLAPNARAKFDAVRNEVGGTATVVSTDTEAEAAAESFAAEGTPSRDNDRVAVGDRVRSYDFVIGDTLLRDDCYIEGTVTKIGEWEYCPCGTDHVFIVVEEVVRQGEKVSATGMDMAFPVITESFITVLDTEVRDSEMLYAPEYYVHSPDEFYGPYYSLEEAEEAVERLMRRGIEIRGITEGQDNWMSEMREEYGCDRCGEEVPDGNAYYPKVAGNDDDTRICEDCYFEDSQFSIYEAQSWKTCAMCGEPASFTVEDTPVGSRNFCCERCYAQYMGLPVEEPGYYGLEAEDWNWGGDPDGPLAKALRKVKNNPKKIKPLELVRLPKSDEEVKEAETWSGPFGIETRTPTGAFKKWEKVETYDKLVDKLTEMFENEGFNPYALDVYAEQMPRVQMTATGPVVVNDRKVLLATYKYGKWESGPWMAYLPKP